MKRKEGREKDFLVKKALGIIFWAVIITLCFIYRDMISVENIVAVTPENTVLAIILLLSLYAIKGVAIFIYGGILYVVGGILFPLPLAILVNAVGTVIMTGIPYYIGKKGGRNMVNNILERHPKLEVVRSFQNKNEFFLCFFIRIVGMLPADIVAMYLGATGIGAKNYFLGTVTGLFSAIICFTVMGMSIDEPGSPQFIISLAAEILLAIGSIIVYLIIKKRNG